MLHNMWPLVLDQKPLKCQENPSSIHKMQQTTGAAGGAYSAPPDPLAGGEGLAAPSPRTLPRSRPATANRDVIHKTGST